MPDYTYEDWKSRADALSLRHQAFIGGKFVDAASGETFYCIRTSHLSVLVG